jgi:hypothetical protein
MANAKPTPDAYGGIRPLSIEQLEAGLSIMDDADVDRAAFLDSNIDAFRKTVIVAIRDTVDALRSPAITAGYRDELEGQIGALWGYVEIADEYVAQRARMTTIN